MTKKQFRVGMRVWHRTREEFGTVQIFSFTPTLDSTSCYIDFNGEMLEVTTELLEEAKMTYIVDDVTKIKMPSKFAKNQRTLKTVDCKTIIITHENNCQRTFGGASIKLAVKGEGTERLWVSSSIEEQSLKDIVSYEFQVTRESLYRFY